MATILQRIRSGRLTNYVFDPTGAGSLCYWNATPILFQVRVTGSRCRASTFPGGEGGGGGGGGGGHASRSPP